MGHKRHTEKHCEPPFKSHFEHPLEQHPFGHFRRMRKILRENPELREKFSKGRKFRKQGWGIRKRLTVIFAFVALAAVFLNTWFTLGSVYSALFPDAPEAYKHAFWKWKHMTGPEHAQAREVFQRITGTAFMSAMFSFFLASMAAGAVTRIFTSPLIKLTEGAKRLERGERGLKLRLPSMHSELRTLTEAFNNLVTGLERQENWRRNLVADIAHDLRTPLAVMRSEIEAMQDGVTPTDEQALDRLHHQVMLLSQLVTDLRTLSLAESGGMQLRTETLKLQDFLRDVVQAYQRRAGDLGLEIVLETIPPSLTAVFDPAQITRVLNNLLENATNYAQGPIEIQARRTERGTQITVRDHGSGIPPEALERVFERFYKGDFSRTRQSRGDGGSGLGLPIARAIVEAHGGTLEAGNHPEGGAIFTLLFGK
ncbi:sensor histidine kinase [Deinococcus cellulosilyticus]|uniref:histidine kinase n=1 Tax=Deinococcus cellulosilyticus (strain DSM 18568 / NBRC 106333 / KACC 11606 / 5516J-15) TaxID=1223518 RepID=A0A511N2S4_DEIC1|nr:ATP-binding protein [Deinococcus cellulosilyticus]GEM46807.1 hypothetical protein DC3_24420 [Deinococcus cellulosilyticus NBRC 106333 = KACC 11606]